MRMTRVALVLGVLALGALCFLVAIGFTVLLAPLVTAAVLVVLVAGGNYLSSPPARTSPVGAPQGADPEDPDQGRQ